MVDCNTGKPKPYCLHFHIARFHRQSIGLGLLALPFAQFGQRLALPFAQFGQRLALLFAQFGQRLVLPFAQFGQRLALLFAQLAELQECE